MPLEYLYTKLVNGLVSTLLNELLVLGIFFVLYGYISQIVRNPDLLFRAALFKRMVLLGLISLFVFYVALTYFMPYTDISVRDVVSKLSEYSQSEQRQAVILLLMMSPIDLLSIVLLAAMYATLGIESSSEIEKIESESLDKQLINLFLITSSWHFVTVVWWVVFYFLALKPYEIGDIGYHSLFGVLQLLGYLGWRWLHKMGWNNWLGIGYFALLVLTVYVTRIWMYVYKLA